ncbi:MAG TPA: SDR family NAD(P)-dependent oxidoreductase [Spirochaetia bacterium]|nr:SDR family NAD(P)-dependent oxidoreductase [Spirochaetia bacterium]
MGTPGILSGRTALIVGGTGGIGREVARALAARGADLILHGGHDRRKGEDLVRELSAGGVKVRLVMAEIAALEDADLLGVQASGADILVCGFGPFLRTPLDGMSRAEWRNMCELNLALPGYLVSSAVARMAERRYGRIILFGGTGTAVPRGYKTVAAYSAAKIGLGVIAKSVADNYGRQNVTCNVIVPGYVDTEYLSDADRTSFARRSPSGLLARPEIIARWVTEVVCSDEGLPNGAILELS